MVPVLVPSQLHAYTSGASRLTADGATIDEVLTDLDRRFPGLRFRLIDEQDRIRPHGYGSSSGPGCGAAHRRAAGRREVG